MWKYFRSGRSELTQSFYSRGACAIWRQTWRLILLANRVTNFAHARYKLNGCRQRLLFAHQLTQRKCSPCRLPSRAATPKRKCDTSEGGGGVIFWYYTQGPGICLDPGQPCGRHLSLIWFQSRTWNRFEFMVMSISDHHCTSASGMHACTLAKCARYSWIWCEILHLCTTTASE